MSRLRCAARSLGGTIHLPITSDMSVLLMNDLSIKNGYAQRCVDFLNALSKNLNPDLQSTDPRTGSVRGAATVRAAIRHRNAVDPQPPQEHFAPIDLFEIKRKHEALLQNLLTASKQDLREAALVSVAVVTGLRATEAPYVSIFCPQSAAARLRANPIQDTRVTAITLNKLKCRDRGEHVSIAPCCQPLDAGTWIWLYIHRCVVDDQRTLRWIRTAEDVHLLGLDEVLFKNEDGSRLSEADATAILHDTALQCGEAPAQSVVPGSLIGAHSFRATAATVFFALGADPTEVARCFRWKDPAILAQRYITARTLSGLREIDDPYWISVQQMLSSTALCVPSQRLMEVVSLWAQRVSPSTPSVDQGSAGVADMEPLW